MYAVVEFMAKDHSSSNEISVVPLTWIFKNGKRCYWPIKTNKVPFSTFVEDLNPPSKSWPHFPVFKIHFQTLSYNLAEEKLRCVIQGIDEIGACSNTSGRSVVQKSIQSDIESSTDEEEPQKNKRMKQSSPQPLMVNLLPLEQQRPFVITPSLTSESTSTITVTTGDLEFLDLPQSLESGSNNQNIAVASTSQASNNSTDFQEIVLSSLASLATTNNEILLTMQEILRYNKKISLEKLIAPENLPRFPLSNMAQFADFEELLRADPVVSQYMVRRLAALGGSGIEGVTRRIMKFILKNELGLLFNWKGRHHKIAFETTALMSVIYEAAKLNFPVNEKNDHTVSTSVKEWLKHSSTRINQKPKNQDT